jgi:hypothetical protein
MSAATILSLTLLAGITIGGYAVCRMYRAERAARRREDVADAVANAAYWGLIEAVLEQAEADLELDKQAAEYVEYLELTWDNR